MEIGMDSNDGGREILNGKRIIELHVDESDMLWPDSGMTLKESIPDELDIEGQTGFCIKTRDVKSGRKLFINITHNPGIERPQMMPSPEELAHLLSTEKADKFTVPMLIKTLFYTRDKSGDESALVIDVVINTHFFQTYVASNDLYETVVVTFALELVEAKFEARTDFPVSGWSLEKHKWTKLTNKKRQSTMRTAQKSTCKTPYNKPPPKHVKEELDRLMDGSVIPLGKIKVHEGSDEPRDADELMKVITQSTKSANKAAPRQIIKDPTVNFRLAANEKILRMNKIEPNLSDADDVRISLNDERIELETGSKRSVFYLPIRMKYKSEEILATVDYESKMIRVEIPIE